MKKSAKIIIIIGIAFILAGGIFFGAAYAFGENQISAKLSSVSKTFALGDVNTINIDGAVANVRILKTSITSDSVGSALEISVQSANIIESAFNCELTNGILKISYNQSTVKFGFVTLPSGMFNWNKNSPVINIYIPDGKLFDEVYFTGNVGSVNIENISSKDFTIDGGVGSFTADNINITNSFNISGRVGETAVTKAVIAGNTKIDGGVGSINISGQIDGDMTINGGVGNITLDLSGNVGDYNFNAVGGLGSIKLNGDKINDSTKSSDGKYNIKIDGGVGSIYVNIK